MNDYRYWQYRVLLANKIVQLCKGIYIWIYTNCLHGNLKLIDTERQNWNTNLSIHTDSQQLPVGEGIHELVDQTRSTENKYIDKYDIILKQAEQ